MTENNDQEVIEFANRLFDAARNGETELLQSALQMGAPADMADSKGNTLLMLAAYSGHAATVSAILAAGADVNRLNDRGQSPLAGAIFKREPDVVKVLREAGADLDAGTPSARDTAKMFNVELD